ncbi:MAG: ABC transporter permease [Longimicrobiales bacterium]
MIARPPARTARLLGRALRNDPACAAILGDLHEDYVRRARMRGALSAGIWYRREVVLLIIARLAYAVSSIARRGFGVCNVITVTGLRDDARLALQSIRRSPGLFVMIALVIGLGVGATTSVFSVLRPLMLSPLPMEEPERLVWIERAGEGSSLSSVTSRAINLPDFRERSRTFASMAGYDAFSSETAYTLEGAAAPERLLGVRVTHDFLDVLGVRPLVGRSFTVEEGLHGGLRAVLLSHGFWRRRFAGDRSIVGKRITLNDVPRTVVGVLPPTFDFASLFTPGRRVDFLLPFVISVDARTGYQGSELFFIGRLREGISLEAADRELEDLVRTLQAEDPGRWGLDPLRVMPLHEQVAGPFLPALMLLILAAGAVMLIVCFNVANVLLVRSPSRMRDVAIRKALGATRGRVLRQVFVETILLALPGAAVGVLLAVLATDFVTASSALAIPLLERVGVNGSALLVAVLSALLAGLAAGLAPALQLAEGSESAVLKSSARGISGHRAGRRLREALVVAEIGVTFTLLVAAGLLLRSFQAVLDVELGFESENAVAWQINPGLDFFGDYPELRAIEERTTFYRELAARVAAVPGVDRVGLIDALPLGRNRTASYRIVGPPEKDEVETSFPHIIDPGYLETLRIPVRRGRAFTEADDRRSRPVILLNETAAARLFPGRDAIGQRIVTMGADWEREIIGIVADVRHVSPEDDPGIQIYFPLAQNPNFGTMDMVVRSRLPVEALTGAVSRTMADVDPAMPTREFWTLEATLDRTLSPRRFTLQVLAGFGIAALILAALGIYGVLAHSVAERTREFGIRIALGASPVRVRHLVLGRTLLLAGAGIGIGLAAALATTRLLRSMLFGVSPVDPATIAGMVVILVAVATLSGIVPARRATRADALEALRSE